MLATPVPRHEHVDEGNEADEANHDAFEEPRGGAVGSCADVGRGRVDGGKGRDDGGRGCCDLHFHGLGFQACVCTWLKRSS